MKRSTFVRSGIVVAATAALAPGSVLAQVPEASPSASPVPGVIFPEGPLGDQARWILEVANAGPGRITIAEINAHVSPAFFEETSMPEVFRMLSGLQSAGITYEIDPISFITTMDLPATNGRFILVGSDGSRTEVSLQVERDTGLISALRIEPADTTPTVDA
jgi:hypothetical protein